MTYPGSHSLRVKLSLIFGLFSVLTVVFASYVIYIQAVTEFNKEVHGSLASVSNTLIKILDPVKLNQIQSIKDPYYIELKQLLLNLQFNFNLSWLGIYRHNGRFFTHIVDGSEPGGEFIVDHPVFDTTPEMNGSWEKGDQVIVENYEDSFGTWKTTFTPIKLPDGKVIAIIDSSKSVEQLDRLKNQTFNRGFYLVIGITVVSLVLCFIFSHSLSRPLVQLTESAKLIAAGNLETKISGIESHDEIGLLVRTFNSMTDELLRNKKSLERKIFELTLLFEVSQKINFANNTQEILRLILDKSIEAVKAERGSVMLFNEDSGTLLVDVVAGPILKRIEKRVELKPGEGVAGKVFEDAMPLIINENLHDIFKPYEIAIESEVHNIMCIPLILEKKAIGVINIVNKRSSGFVESDLELASTMGAQIALTIEKSRLYELSITDGLTKLFVHRYFQIALENELKRAKRFSKSLSLLLFDIDHFKKFNDTYGHQLGDAVLYHTAVLVKETVRSIDIPARYGGEEFTVILPETDLAHAYEAAERVRKRIESFDFPGHEKPIKVTISIGISSCPEHTEDRLELIKKADEALYQSKKAGRNCSTKYTPPVKA